MTSINDTKSKLAYRRSSRQGLRSPPLLSWGLPTLSALNIIKATIITISTTTGTEVTIAPLRWSIPAMAGTAITLRRR
jgi:hypothetical protein